MMNEQHDESTHPPRRRRLPPDLSARVLIGVMAFLMLAVLPAAIASRPGFFSRYPGWSEKHASWARSNHAEAACSDCHVRPRPVDQAFFRARMAGEFYLSLAWRWREPPVFSTPTNAACLTCHNDLRSVSPKGDLQIPHRAHVQVLKMDCVECHGFLVHETSAEGKNTPPMSGCLTCHDGDTAVRECSACHTEKAGPASHRQSDWLVVHANKAEDDAECASCHRWATNWCAECHSHRPRSHGRNWRAVHGEHVKAQRSCEACHKPSFCVPCHGEVPKDNLNPALRLVE